MLLVAILIFSVSDFKTVMYLVEGFGSLSLFSLTSATVYLTLIFNISKPHPVLKVQGIILRLEVAFLAEAS